MIKTSNILYIRRALRSVKGRKVLVEVGYSKRDECVFLDISNANILLESDYKCVREMVYNAPRFEDELELRKIVCGGDSLNPIIIIDRQIRHSLKVMIEAYFEEMSVFTLIAGQ